MKQQQFTDLMKELRTIAAAVGRTIAETKEEALKV